jgi:hypothetical protein
METKTPNTVKDPMSESALAEQMTPTINRRMQTAYDNLPEGQGQGTKQVGKWIKRSVMGVGAALFAVWAYKNIREHQKLMNGCWLVNMTGGQKCKIGTLTCDANVEQDMCTNSDLAKCGPGLNATCFPPDECLRYEAEVCKATIGQTECGEGPCHEACNEDLVEVPPNFRLVCVDASFWDAADDFFDDIIHQGTSTLTMLFKAAILVFILVIIYNFSQRQQ